MEVFSESVDGELAESRSFEDAAQIFCDRFYTAFRDTVLVRVFASVPLARLGRFERRFIADFLTRTGSETIPSESDAVLTLFGTRGIEPAWSDRKRSRDHLAIPLLSQSFVEEMPMIARLFDELGFTSTRGSDASWQFFHRPATSEETDADRLFFIGDARTTTDGRGRLVIPASDFVDRYGVRTVFGFGGAAGDGSTLLGIIAFCRNALLREETAPFVDLVEPLRFATAALIDSGKLFSPER